MQCEKRIGLELGQNEWVGVWKWQWSLVDSSYTAQGGKDTVQTKILREICDEFQDSGLDSSRNSQIMETCPRSVSNFPWVLILNTSAHLEMGVETIQK